jgi:cobalt/nickel transport system permease protein
MALDIDRFAHVDSVIQKWDPRFKILSLGVLVFCIALLHTIPTALIALAIATVLLLLARLPLSFVSHGLQFVIIFLLPFFIVMPLTYPGEAAFYVAGVPFAWEGLRLATVIVIKSISIVITAFVIFGTSRFDISMIALQKLKCPKMIVQMLLFTYRYIFVFIAEMRRMDTSMKARGLVKKANMRTMQIMGNFVGTLLVRSFERTERVYKAMLSKGYTGEFHSLRKFEAGAVDVIKLLFIFCVAIALMTADLYGPFSQAELAWY